MPGASSKVALLAGAVAAAGAACVGYGILVERDWYRLRRERVEALAPGQPPLTVLHLSDLHLTVADGRRVAFLERLAGERVDLVVMTGDMLGEPRALDPVLEALGRFRPRLGAVAVLGSNDYWAPRFRNPLGYFLGPSSRRHRSSGRNPWRELVDGLEARGWTVLSNRRGRLGDVELAGMDDPHIRRDDLEVAVPPNGRAPAPAPRGGPQPLPAGPGRLRAQRLRAAAGRPHPRRAGPPARGRGAGDQLRPAPGPGARAVALGVELAARLGRPRHQQVRAVPVRLPARGVAAHGGAQGLNLYHLLEGGW